jgi:hypothetical protein
VHGESSSARTGRIIFVRNRRTENRHYRIAKVAVNTSLFGLNRFRKPPKTLIHQSVNFFRVQSLAD